MLGVCTSGAANSANTYYTPTTNAGDWFLGSLGEMMLMYTNLSYAGVGGFDGNSMWSSTGFADTVSLYQNFLSGSQSTYIKLNLMHARSMRAF